MTIRSTYFIGLSVVALLLTSSLYFQFMDGQLPCPLCTLQRISFAVLGLLFLIGGLIYPIRSIRLLVNVLCILVSFAGVFLAGRQIWLQQYAVSNNNECGVSIQYLMQVLPLHEVAQRIFSGSTECTQRGWEFLYLNMAEWALIWFIGFLMMTIYLLIKECR